MRIRLLGDYREAIRFRIERTASPIGRDLFFNRNSRVSMFACAIS